MSKRDYYSPELDAYILPGAQIHSTEDGRNIAIRNNKVIGEDASLILPEVSIKVPRNKLIQKSDNTQINKSPIQVSNTPTPLNLTRLNSTKYGKILLDKIRLENPIYYDYKVRQEALQNNPKSEIVRYTDHIGKLRQETRVLGLSGTDPFGELYIEGVAFNPIIKGLGKLTKLSLNRISTKWDDILEGQKYIDSYKPEQFIESIYTKNKKESPTIAIVFKGSKTDKPLSNDYTFFTTDPDYAAQYGKVKQGILGFKNPGYTDDPLIYNDMEQIHYFTDLARMEKGLPYSDIIIGKDKVTKEIMSNGKVLNPSKGTEYVIWNPNQWHPLNIQKSILPATRSTLYSPKPIKEYIPNTQNIFQYNAFLDSHFYDKPVKDIIKTFQKNRNINQIESFMPTLTDSQQEQLRNFIRTYKFQASKIPYYTNSKQLLKDHPIIKQNLKDLSKIEQEELLDVDNALIDVGDDYAILAKDPTQRIHEAEHVLQRRRYNSETRGAYLPQQEQLLNKAYIHSKNGIPDAALINEKGAVNQQLRTQILDSFKDNFGRYPSLKELNKYIDEFSDKSLLKLLKNKTNSYGLEYSKNKLNPKTIKEALKYIGATTLILKNNNYEKY